MAAVREGRAPAVDGREALKALEIVLAVYRSAETGKPVELPAANRANDGMSNAAPCAQSATSSALVFALAALGVACNKAADKPAAPPPRPDESRPPPAPAQPPAPPPDPNAPADVKAAPADAEKTPSGLASKVLKPGTGTDKPQGGRQVKVHYTGWTTDGRKFDSSVDRGEPATFPLNQVIKGWTEGVQLMVEGEKRRFWIPAEPGLRRDAQPSRRPRRHAGVRRRAAGHRQGARRRPRTWPRRPRAPRRPSPGIAYQVLKKGTGKEHPKADQHGRGPLHGLDHRRQDVRQLGHARPAGRRSR